MVERVNAMFVCMYVLFHPYSSPTFVPAYGAGRERERERERERKKKRERGKERERKKVQKLSLQCRHFP